MPPQIGDFISRHVYKGELQSHSGNDVPSGGIPCHFVDVNGSEKLRGNGKSPIVSVVLQFLGKRQRDTNHISIQSPEPARSRRNHASRSSPPR